MGLLKEFKEFAVKGNVIDMAVGVIIGGAFSKIVTSLVNDLFMPAISVLLGKIDLTTFAIAIDKGAEEPIMIKIGQFAQNIIDFILVAVCVFAFVKLFSAMKKKPEPEPEAAPAPSAEEVLLTEIRDLLKDKTGAEV